MAFINGSNFLGGVIGSAAQNTFGDVFTTLLVLLIILLAFCMMFRIPLEWASILIFPLLISFAAYYSAFVAPLLVALIYLSAIVTKNWWFK